MREQLFSFLHKLDIKDSQIIDAETYEVLSMRLNLEADILRRINSSDLQELLDVFNTAISLRIGDSVRPIMEIEDGIPSGVLATQLEQLQRVTGEREFLLVVRKETIVQRLGLDPSIAKGFYFFQTQSLLKFLQAPLIRLDQRLFDDVHKPTVILLATKGVLFRGSLLHILSEDLFDPTEFNIIPEVRTLKRVDRYLRVAADPPRWIGFHLQRITPIHFLCRQEIESETTPLTEQITRHLLHLCILFTANRSMILNGNFEATYASSEETAKLIFDPGANVDVDEDTLGRAVLWLIGSERFDRLTIFQNVASRLLLSEEGSQNYLSFCIQLGHLLSETRWNYRTFLDGRINRHLEQIQSVKELIRATVADITSILDSLTKDFTGAFLTTLGVVVASFLGALVKNDISEFIFRWAMKGYAVYLLVFQAGYRMLSFGRGYQLLIREIDQRILDFKERMGATRIENLIKPLPTHKKEFLWWFWITVVLYIVLAIGVWILGVSARSYLVDIGAIKPETLPTPTMILTPVKNHMPIGTLIP